MMAGRPFLLSKGNCVLFVTQFSERVLRDDWGALTFLCDCNEGVSRVWFIEGSNVHTL